MSSHVTNLKVRMMAAFDLPPVNLGGRTSDPYAMLSIARTKETHKTDICLNTVNPMWYETMAFHSVRPSDVIQVSIFDSSVMTIDKSIGTAQISLGSALSHATAVASESAYQAKPHHPETRYPSKYSASQPQQPSAPPPEDDAGANPSPAYVPPPPLSHDQSTHAYPSYYPTPPEYHQQQPPPPPPPPTQPHYPNVSHDENFSFVPPRIQRADAHMQRLMTMNYRLASRGTITMVIAPDWVPDLEQGAPKKGFKRFQIHKLQDQVGKQSIGSSIGKMIKSGAEKAKPLQTALHALDPIHAVFQEHSTWKITLLDVDAIFQGKRHSWNQNYPAAQKIFKGHGSVVTRRMVQMQHAYLYGGGSHLKPVQNMRKELQEVTGNLIDGKDFLSLMEYGVRRGKPRLFTYVIMPNRLYLAETGAKFFRDMLSKHAMHCSASTEVVYAGELHFRRFPPHSAEPEFQLVVDNNSGTYAPGKEDLPLVAEVFRRNFPGLHVVALDYQSPILKQFVSELPPSHSHPEESHDPHSGC